MKGILITAKRRSKPDSLSVHSIFDPGQLPTWSNTYRRNSQSAFCFIKKGEPKWFASVLSNAKRLGVGAAHLTLAFFVEITEVIIACPQQEGVQAVQGLDGIENF